MYRVMTLIAAYLLSIQANAFPCQPTGKVDRVSFEGTNDTGYCRVDLELKDAICQIHRGRGLKNFRAVVKGPYMYYGDVKVLKSRHQWEKDLFDWENVHFSEYKLKKIARAQTLVPCPDNQWCGLTFDEFENGEFTYKRYVEGKGKISHTAACRPNDPTVAARIESILKRYPSP